jgi:SAM-dependent methyltransferase
LNSTSRLIDIGGGASTLVDDLLDVGLTELTVLDLSPAALAISRDRLGERAACVRWLAADMLQVDLPPGAYDLWHDRAVLHFLTTAEQTARYAAQASHAIAVGGHAVIGGFAPDGPERCSGLTVARRSPDEVAALLGPTFRLVETHTECHLTPNGNEQAFAWALLRRV